MVGVGCCKSRLQVETSSALNCGLASGEDGREELLTIEKVVRAIGVEWLGGGGGGGGDKD